MTKSLTEHNPNKFDVAQVRSNEFFERQTLEKKIHYNKCLARGKNPDFLIKHAQEVRDASAEKPNYLELVNRVTKEYYHERMIRYQRQRKGMGKRRSRYDIESIEQKIKECKAKCQV